MHTIKETAEQFAVLVPPNFSLVDEADTVLVLVEVPPVNFKVRQAIIDEFTNELKKVFKCQVRIELDFTKRIDGKKQMVINAYWSCLPFPMSVKQRVWHRGKIKTIYFRVRVVNLAYLECFNWCLYARTTGSDHISTLLVVNSNDDINDIFPHHQNETEKPIEPTEDINGSETVIELLTPFSN